MDGTVSANKGHKRFITPAASRQSMLIDFEDKSAMDCTKNNREKRSWNSINYHCGTLSRDALVRDTRYRKIRETLSINFALFESLEPAICVLSRILSAESDTRIGERFESKRLCEKINYRP